MGSATEEFFNVSHELSPNFSNPYKKYGLLETLALTSSRLIL
jgi:hypothetical protein